MFKKSFKFQTMHIRDYLRDKGFMGQKKELRMKDFNAYLKLKLNLDKKELAKRCDEVVALWDKYFARIRALE